MGSLDIKHENVGTTVWLVSQEFLSLKLVGAPHQKPVRYCEMFLLVADPSGFSQYASILCIQVSPVFMVFVYLSPQFSDG